MLSGKKKENCIVCGAKLLGDLVHVGQQYPSAVYPDKPTKYRSAMRPSSLNLTKCSNNKCGLVQLAHEYDLSHVLKNYPYLSSGTATMTAILTDAAREAEKLVSLEKDDVALDIGGNDGTLLSLLSRDVKRRINIDAAHNVVSILDDSNYLRIQEKFSAKAYLNLGLASPKVIFSVAMFYHLDDPLKFCREVRKIMSDSTIWCIQMTYLGSMLEANIYDNIVHEHVGYYSLKSLEYVLNKAGLVVRDAKIVTPYGGSLRVYVTTKNGKIPGYPKQYVSKNYSLTKNYEYEQGTNTVDALKMFDMRVALLREFTRELIAHIVGKNGKIYAMGASTKGNMICQFIGIDSNHIECVLDNNKKKIGLIMTGSDIPIVDEKEYLPMLKEYLLILPYYYMDFFKALVAKYLKKDQHVYLIIPLPKPRLVKLCGSDAR